MSSVAPAAWPTQISPSRPAYFTALIADVIAPAMAAISLMKFISASMPSHLLSPSWATAFVNPASKAWQVGSCRLVHDRG